MAVRVIQWATGAIGSEALKLVLDHPGLELAGVRVYSPEKVGVDAGVLAGRAPVGVAATADVAAILATPADVVIYTPTLDADADVDGEIAALLRSGKNVISTRAHIWPPASGPDYASRLLQAAVDGNASLYGTGVNPGFFNDRLGAAVTSMCSDVRSIDFGMAYDLALRTEHTVFDVCMMAAPPESIGLELPVMKTLQEVYLESFHILAHQLGTRVRRITPSFELGLATRDLVVKGRPVPKGTVGGIRLMWRVDLERGPVIRYEFRFYVDHDLPGWDLRHVRTITIDGDPPLEVVFTVGDSPPGLEKYESTARAMAALAVNAIPDVIAAPPGFVLPTIFAPWRVPPET